ncbi:MAG TPA: NAD-dependent epimerase/dehydratase family protein, partial [Verrucomicrobiae bacterium]|nr:NAD-dependent epimerase/dehydratase family protein [Verrucomicrobiae bacterium]
ASKASATMAALALAAERQVELAVLRPFHVFGEDEPEFRFWPQLREAALRGTNFPMTAGGQVRDFVPVEEVARVFVEFLGAPLAAGRPEIYNVGTGAPRSLREFAEHWWRKWQAPGRLLPGQIPYRDNEVMRYVPKIVPLPGQIRQPASS